MYKYIFCLLLLINCKSSKPKSNYFNNEIYQETDLIFEILNKEIHEGDSIVLSVINNSQKNYILPLELDICENELIKKSECFELYFFAPEIFIKMENQNYKYYGESKPLIDFLDGEDLKYFQKEKTYLENFTKNKMVKIEKKSSKAIIINKDYVQYIFTNYIRPNFNIEKSNNLFIKIGYNFDRIKLTGFNKIDVKYFEIMRGENYFVFKDKIVSNECSIK
jgi:hypothetical protein